MNLDQPSLLDWQPRYPATPGWKAGDTSREAAEAVTETAAFIRQQALAALRRKPMTADQVAEAIGRTPAGTRPRISELKADGKIYDTGRRDINVSTGLSAKIWAAFSAPANSPIHDEHRGAGQ